MKQLTQYFLACNDLVEKFLQDVYREDADVYIKDLYWVGDRVGGTVEVADMFLSMENIVDYFGYNYTFDQLFCWYWDNLEKEDWPNMKHYAMNGFEWPPKKRDREKDMAKMIFEIIFKND